MITYDSDGGDLGRSDLKPIETLELLIIIPHIANILENLYYLNSRLHYKYAIEIHHHAKKSAELLINDTKLPSHVKWYECDEKKLFDMRGASGGIISHFICYLITGN